MFTISVVFGKVLQPWVFLYKNGDAARERYNALMAPENLVVSIADDYGQEASFNAAEIAGVLFENLDMSATGQIERGLHQARTQIKGNQMAEADPVLKTASLVRPGNGVMFPPGPMPRA